MFKASASQYLAIYLSIYIAPLKRNNFESNNEEVIDYQKVDQIQPGYSQIFQIFREH